MAGLYICRPTTYMSHHRYFIINKPYRMLSQFVSREPPGEVPVVLLGDLDFDFPEGIHAVGRLDADSEGLLILTTNKRVTRLLFQGQVPHRRTYLVRVKNEVTLESLLQLRTGVSIRVKGGEYYTTPPCEVDIIEAPTHLFAHQLELRDYVKHTWLRVSLYEGKFHQVRKMVSAVGHPCKRLVRVSIEDLLLGSLAPGGVRELEEADFFALLKIDDWQ